MVEPTDPPDEIRPGEHADDGGKGEGGGASRPPRRPRYRGTHPRRFAERYKEFDPVRHPEMQGHIRAQGRTPAGSHVPVMLAEVIAALHPAPGETGLDCTLGHGGHARALAAAVGPTGRIVALDVDSEEIGRVGVLDAEGSGPITAVHANFSGAAGVLRDLGIAGVDFLLADLGVSSMQLDRPERGFSFKNDGPLDLRLDRSRGKPASDLLATIDEQALADLLNRLGDEDAAPRIAAEIIHRRTVGRPIDRTVDLAHVVLRARGLDPRTWQQQGAFRSHPAARVFQALRIAVNREFEHLAALLRDLPWLLAPNGRAAIITFHSGEAAMVDDALRRHVDAGALASVEDAPRMPTGDEVAGNPRARSARLHVATRGA